MIVHIQSYCLVPSETRRCEVDFISKSALSVSLTFTVWTRNK